MHGGLNLAKHPLVITISLSKTYSEITIPAGDPEFIYLKIQNLECNAQKEKNHPEVKKRIYFVVNTYLKILFILNVNASINKHYLFILFYFVLQKRADFLSLYFLMKIVTKRGCTFRQ
jgi:hypothetical protein